MDREFDGEQIRDLMKEAVKAVEETGVPEDLRESAFEKMFDALLVEAQLRGQRAGGEERIPSAAPISTNGPSLQAIAARLGLEPELVDEIFHVAGDALGLSIAASIFDPSKARGAQQISLLLAAGRQAGGWDEWTPIRILREACRDYGRFDAANFASTIKRMGNAFSFRGRGQQVELRVTRPGYEQAAALARELRES